MRMLMKKGFWSCLITFFFVMQLNGQEAGKSKISIIDKEGIGTKEGVPVPAPAALKTPAVQPTPNASTAPTKTIPTAAAPAPAAGSGAPALAMPTPKIPVAVPVAVPIPAPTAVSEKTPAAAAPVPAVVASTVTEEEAAPVAPEQPVTPEQKETEGEETATEVPAPAPIAAVPAAPVASEEFDTSKIKEYGGNWYFKRAWWQNAEGEYEKARQVLEQLFEARMSFFEKRNELERTLFEPLYRNMGFEQGELQDTIVYLIDQIESGRKDEGTLNIKEREFLTALQEEKKTLEQLKLDMDQLAKFDDAIDDAVNMLVKEINQARQYEQTAWKEFKAIAEDLSDIKARERYYTIRTLYKDIKNIYDYVRGDFKKYFDNVEDVSRKEAERIKSGVKELKNKGIDLKEEAKKLTEIPAKPAPKPPEPAKAEEPGYIMGTIYSIGGFFKSAWNLIFGWIYHF